MRILSKLAAKIATAAIATGVAASAAFAGVGGTPDINVTLSQPVSVGSTTLPSGEYRIIEMPSATTERMFLFRDQNGATAAVATGSGTVSPPEVNSSGLSQKTEVVLKPSEDGTLHLRDLFLEGDRTGFYFRQ